MTGDVGLLQGEEMISAQLGHRTGSCRVTSVPGPEFSCRAQQPPVIPTIMCKMEND